MSPPPSSTAVKHGPCLLTEKKRIQAFETKCTRKLLRVSYLEHKTNDWLRSKIIFLVGPLEPLLAIVTRQKLAWFGHVTRHDSLSKTVSGYLGEWATLCSAEEMLDRQHRKADVPAHARTSHKGLLHNGLEEDLMSSPTTQLVKGLN